MDAAAPNYVVVARRYRPQTFVELIGQQHVAQALTGAITSDRVGHAYLFTGARGVGKTSAARILAKALNCAAGTSPTPCGTCEICDSVAAGDDVDVLEIDGASNRGIDEIRQLRQNAAVRPSRARYKIYIIDEVHMLTKEAFNALLKTLEEPPEHVKFIFATTEPNKIPITILSRCQRYDFAGIESQAIAARLSEIASAEGVTVEPEALQLLAIRAAGSMRDSQSLLEQLLASGGNRVTSADVTSLLGLAPAARLGALVQALAARNAAAALTHLDEALAEGTEVGQLVDQLLGFFRDAMTQAVGCDSSRLLYALPSQSAEVAAVAQQLGLQTVLAATQILDQAAARMRMSTQVRTLAEMALVRIAHLGDLQSLADLAAKLSGIDAAPPVKKNGIASTKTLSPPAPSPEPTTRLSAGAPPPETLPVEPRSDDAGSAAAAHATTLAGTVAVAASASAAVVTPVIEASAVASADRPAETQVATENASSLAAVAEGDPVALWQATVSRLTGLIAENAAAATRFAFDAHGGLVVSFPENLQFSRDACQRPANLAKISDAMVESYGRPLTLILETHEATDDPTARPVTVASRREQQAEVATQPFVKRAIELFDVDEARLRYVPPQSHQ